MTEAKKAVLATFGTLGDIYPFIAIARALETRGFEPTIVAPDMHRRAIEDEGLRYAHLRPNLTDVTQALGVDVPGAFRLMLKNPHFILDEIYLRFLHETYEDVLRASIGADVIFTHSLLVAASQAAEKLDIPSARLVLAPLYLQSAASPPWTPGAPYSLKPKGCGGLIYNRLVRRSVRFMTDVRMSRLRRFRKSVGLPSTQEDFFLDFGRNNTADAIFGLFSPLFSPPQPDHPKNLIVPGFPFYKSHDPARRALDPALNAFLAAGEPPIVFTLGSFAPDVSGDFYDNSIRAARNLGRRAVLLAGDRDAARLASRVTENEFLCQRAPHSQLFPRSLCIVHHGGIGTTAEAMRAGRPQFVVPFFGDQPDNGRRIERLGLGLTLALGGYNKESATQALKTLLSGEYCSSAGHFSLRIAGEDGATAVADWATCAVASSRRSASTAA